MMLFIMQVTYLMVFALPDDEFEIFILNLLISTIFGTVCTAVVMMIMKVLKVM